MAEFHYYTLTIEAKITVPATAGGTAQTFNISGIPAAAKAMLAGQLLPAGAAVTTPTLTLGSAVEVP